MDNTNIYNKIKDVAYQLKKDNSTFTRADLAFELKVKDSLEVSKLAWEAYNYYHNDVIIKNSFYNNEGKQLIISEYEVCHFINENESENFFPLFDKQLNNIDKSIQDISNEIAISLESEVFTSSSNLISKITGASGATKIQQEATNALNSYTNLVDSYLQLKSDIKSTIAGFVFLRGEIDKIYRQYAMTLIDIFGNSIKSVSPQMFDFDTIEWLDVAGMLKNIQLEYNGIYDSCNVHIADISRNFGNALQLAANNYKSAGSKSGGLTMAALVMFNHYVDSRQKTNMLKNQFLTLKDEMRKDATHIKGDLGRLLVIYKQINDFFIPKANAFYRYDEQILSNEYEQLLKAIYKNPEIKKLKEQRDQILSDYTISQQNIVDNEMNINYYINHISENKDILSKRTQQYYEAKNRKPTKPFFLFNWLSFGALRRSYNRNIFEWDQVCSPVIKEYESLQLDIKMDEDDLNQQNEDLKNNESQSKQFKLELDKLSKEISMSLTIEDGIKEEMSNHLESIIRLLWVAKDILNSKLDERSLHTVTITEPNELQLPKELENNIATFANSIRNFVAIDTRTAKSSVNCVQTNLSSQKDTKNNNQNNNISDADLEKVTIAENQAVQNSINLIEQSAQLKARQVNSELIGKEYDYQLQKLQNTFREDLSKIDKRSAVLNEVLKKINTAKDKEVLKDGLLQLAELKDMNITKDDLNDFFDGNKTLEL